MPKRKRIVRYPSDEIQGEGSWVLVALLTVAEMREVRKEQKAKDADMFELGVTLMKSHVKDWNWVDDEGEPMPSPKDQPGIVEGLSDPESGFLSECIRGSESETKN